MVHLKQLSGKSFIVSHFVVVSRRICDFYGISNSTVCAFSADLYHNNIVVQYVVLSISKSMFLSKSICILK